MAYANLTLINALRETAARLRNGAYYAWGHHGGCNCGNLVQVLADLNKEEVLALAHTAPGEWTEITAESCSITHLPLMDLMRRLEAAGLTPTDINHVEYLTDRKVLNALPGGFRWLKRNQREEVILYFETFANVLEEELLKTVQLDSLLTESFLPQ